MFVLMFMLMLNKPMFMLNKQSPLFCIRGNVLIFYIFSIINQLEGSLFNLKLLKASLF